MRTLFSLAVPMAALGLLAACGGGSESTMDGEGAASTPALPSATSAAPTPVSLIGDVGSTLATSDGVSVNLQSIAVNGAPGGESWDPDEEEEPVGLPEGAVWPVDGYRIALTTEVTNNSPEALNIPADFVTVEVTPSDAEGFKIQCTSVSLGDVPDMQPGVAVGATTQLVSRFVCPGQRAEEPLEAIYTVPPAATRLVFVGQLPYQVSTDATAGQPG
jgi:hypothetical protein